MRYTSFNTTFNEREAGDLDRWFLIFLLFNQIFNKLHFLFLFTFKTIDALNHVQILNIEVGESLAAYSMQTS